MSVLWWAVIVVLAVGGYLWYASDRSPPHPCRGSAWPASTFSSNSGTTLIPNVLTIAQRFMEHERSSTQPRSPSLASKSTSARRRPRLQQGHREARDRGAARAADGPKLLMLAENYPQLKADGPMIEAQRTYTEIETNIAAARRFYNTSAARARTSAVQTFPGPAPQKRAPVCTTMPPFFQTTEAARTARRWTPRRISESSPPRADRPSLQRISLEHPPFLFEASSWQSVSNRGVVPGVHNTLPLHRISACSSRAGASARQRRRSASRPRSRSIASVA